jgi:hypothetical protein
MTANANPQSSPSVTTISGRISAVDAWPVKNPIRYTTLVRQPADDEYTTPATVELSSTHSLGKEGDVIQVQCSVSGRYRSYQATHKLSGEVRTVKTADNILTVL